MVSVYVDGVEELNEISVQLHRASGRVGAGAQKALKGAAEFVEANAKAIVPVDSGRLQGSIGPPRYSGDGRFGDSEATITASADYAVYVEYGTRDTAPQAFMGPSADRAGPLLLAAAVKFSDPLDGP